MKQVLGIFALVLAVLALTVSACGSGGNGGSSSGASFMTKGPGLAMFLQWTRAGESLSGSISSASIEVGASDLQSQTAAFSGVISGSSVALTIPQGLGAVKSLSGTLSGSKLRLSVPSADGTLTEDTFVSAKIADYNAAVRDLRQKLTASSQSPSPDVGGGGATPVAADTSGDYATLVARANGLYDQGAAQMTSGTPTTQSSAYFASAAKVYKAAWTVKPGDPNVGTDLATSIFYAGDVQGALKQLDVVLAADPRFQAALYDKGIFLAHESKLAQDNGQAQSYKDQARQAYSKAVSVDPSSAVGTQAAAALKALPD